MFKFYGLTFKSLTGDRKSQTLNFECLNSSNIRPIDKIAKLMTGIAGNRDELTQGMILDQFV